MHPLVVCGWFGDGDRLLQQQFPVGDLSNPPE